MTYTDWVDATVVISFVIAVVAAGYLFIGAWR